MTYIGQLSLQLSFVVTIYALVCYYLGAKNEKYQLIKSADTAVFILLGLMLLTSTALIYAFFNNDYSIEYVYNYSNRDLAPFYKFSAFWAGQKGSLLLWALLLSLFGVIVLLQNRHKNRILLPVVMKVILGVTLFFISTMLFSTNPFEKMMGGVIPEDGHGLNPMLQNPGMVIHPPTLYIGYVGMTVPFAFAIAALIKEQLGDIWIRSTRRWTLFSWMFLTLGNLFGAQWAYVELGWGGYWAWDPVENASFMPWLVATAYLHSVMIQEKKDMLKVWNMSLIILTFSLTIFGTFITRSGLIQSVHSFDETTLGYYFLAFLAFIMIASFGLVIKRFPALKSKNSLDSIVSRESSFLLNNLLLLGIAFATLWGTLFPIISEAVRGIKITVGPPFFNQVNVPIGLALLLLAAICPLIAWRKATVKNIQKNFLIPFIFMVIGGGALVVLLPTFDVFAWLAFSFSIFLTVTIVIEFYKGANVRAKQSGKNILNSFFSLINRNKRRYGGYIVHLGVVCCFVGIAGSSSYSTEKTEMLKEGEEMNIRNYTLQFEKIDYVKENETKEVITAKLNLFKDGKVLRQMKPEKQFFNKQQPVTDVDIYQTIFEDVYVIFSSYSDDLKTGTFKVFVNPLTAWLWIGGWIMALGTIIAILPDKLESSGLAKRYNRKL
ncbi:MAG: heme lyase CcmF/NrfE family subunit [Nitrospinae bacterium]|nr:heme lyase CcmF/NrfE family subunit [Nitrospinota bacterium]